MNDIDKPRTEEEWRVGWIVRENSTAFWKGKAQELERMLKALQSTVAAPLGPSDERLKVSTNELKASASGPLREELPGALWLAKWFHHTYEELAPLHGYETRNDTRDFDATSANGKLMIDVCERLRAALNASPATSRPVSTTGDQGG